MQIFLTQDFHFISSKEESYDEDLQRTFLTRNLDFLSTVYKRLRTNVWQTLHAIR